MKLLLLILLASLSLAVNAATCLVWAPPIFVDAESPAGSRDGKNHVFQLAHAPVIGSTPIVTLNGLVQKMGLGNDYGLAGNTITFYSAAAIPQNATENLLVWYRWQP